jgi:hypothetical protein
MRFSDSFPGMKVSDWTTSGDDLVERRRLAALRRFGHQCVDVGAHGRVAPRPRPGVSPQIKLVAYAV